MSFASLGTAVLPEIGPPLRGKQPTQWGYARAGQEGADARFLGTLPVTELSGFRGPQDTISLITSHCLGEFGERSMLVRQFTEWVLRGVQPKDYLGEILALRNVFVQPSPWIPGFALFHYINDPRHVEMVKTPDRMVKEILEQGSTLVDCDDVTCMLATMGLLIGRNVELVALGFAVDSLSHIAVRMQEPKTNQWIWCDGVAGPREKDAAGRAKNILTKSLD
jgi:hypothetical protein